MVVIRWSLGTRREEQWRQQHEAPILARGGVTVQDQMDPIRSYMWTSDMKETPGDRAERQAESPALRWAAAPTSWDPPLVSVFAQGAGACGVAADTMARTITTVSRTLLVCMGPVLTEVMSWVSGQDPSERVGSSRCSGLVLRCACACGSMRSISTARLSGATASHVSDPGS